MVISIIGILVAAASPSFVQWMKDKRVTDAAANIADLYRTARARAMGRGAATVVRFNASASMPTTAVPGGHFVMREAIAGPIPGQAFSPLEPVGNCMSPNFADNSPTSRFITGFDERRKRYIPAVARFLNAGGATQTYGEICYTPRGRVFMRTAANGAFVAFNGVPRIEVENADDGMRRHVILTPTGAARVVMRIP
jgi:type II secretory pathway pseudopilin PulG